MKSSEREEYVNYRLEKALETFEVAELLVQNKKWNSALNRLYYSVYYAISGLLVQQGIDLKTHAGVKTQFFLYFIKTGLRIVPEINSRFRASGLEFSPHSLALPTHPRPLPFKRRGAF